jgi:hypothetical protein
MKRRGIFTLAPVSPPSWRSESVIVFSELRPAASLIPTFFFWRRQPLSADDTWNMSQLMPNRRSAYDNDS